MRHISTIIVATLLLLAVNISGANIKTGIEVLREEGFKVLEGKRVGLTTNPTGVDSHLKSTIDILWEAKEVNLVALYGPEHGVRGNVSSTRLEATFPYHGSGAMTRSPSPLAWRPDFPGAPREAH